MKSSAQNKIVIKEEVPFYTSVYHGILDLDTDELVDYVLKLADTTAGDEVSNRGGWQSKKFVYQSNAVMQPVIDHVLVELNRIYAAMGIGSPPQPGNYWFNVNHKYDYNISHDHPGSYFSAVWYIKVPKNSGVIVLERPDPLASTIPVVQNNPRNWATYFIEPTEKSLVIFPSYLRHYVEQNLTTDEDDTRISIAMNFK